MPIYLSTKHHFASSGELFKAKLLFKQINQFKSALWVLKFLKNVFE